MIFGLGIRTMSIIEKGTWDDLFPIEGGGLIHMKLQFILNDEERNRIRSVVLSLFFFFHHYFIP